MNRQSGQSNTKFNRLRIFDYLLKSEMPSKYKWSPSTYDVSKLSRRLFYTTDTSQSSTLVRLWKCWIDQHFLCAMNVFHAQNGSFLTFFQNKRVLKCCWVDTFSQKNAKLWLFSFKFGELRCDDIKQHFHARTDLRLKRLSVTRKS